MELEDEFGIAIPDSDAERMRSVGDVVEYVAARRERILAAACPSAHTFYAVRRALTTAAEARRSDVRPAAALVALAPARVRRRLWRQLHEEGLRPPRLTLPPGVRPAVLVAACAIVLAGAASLAATPRVSQLIVVAIAGIACLTATAVALRPLALRIPGGLATVADLVLATKSAPAARDRPEIEARVRRVVGNQFNVAPESINVSTRFVEDLGAD